MGIKNLRSIISVYLLEITTK